MTLLRGRLLTPITPTHMSEATVTHRSKIALGLHALAHDIATGDRPIGIKWYVPEPGTRLYPVPVLPEAVHDALCTSTAVNLSDETEHVHICDECKLAVEDAA